MRFDQGIGLDSRDPGQPYVLMDGRSGLMLDCGIDLAFVPYSTIEEIYYDFLSQEELLALRSVLGLRGADALRYLNNSLILQGIRIDDEPAAYALEIAVEPSWKGALRRWPNLIHDECPTEVQEAALDLVYCRGAMNRHLRVLDFPIKKREWWSVGKVMSEMQQRSRNKFDKERRSFFAKRITETITEEADHA